MYDTMISHHNQPSWEHLVIEPAENVPFWTPKQGGLTKIAGTVVNADPPLLFRPLRIRSLQLQNRLIVAPRAQYSCHDGHATPWHQQHLGSIAVRGPGSTWTEASAITEHGRSSLFETGIWKESHIAAWRSVGDIIHSQGQNIGIQLVHAGRKGSMVPQWVSEGFDIMPKEAGGYADDLVVPSPIPYNDRSPPPNELTA